MVGIIAIDLKSNLPKVRISNVSGFQILTVLESFLSQVTAIYLLICRPKKSAPLNFTTRLSHRGSQFPPHGGLVRFPYRSKRPKIQFI